MLGWSLLLCKVGEGLWLWLVCSGHLGDLESWFSDSLNWFVRTELFLMPIASYHLKAFQRRTIYLYVFSNSHSALPLIPRNKAIPKRSPCTRLSLEEGECLHDPKKIDALSYRDIDLAPANERHNYTIIAPPIIRENSRPDNSLARKDQNRLHRATKAVRIYRQNGKRWLQDLRPRVYRLLQAVSNRDNS